MLKESKGIQTRKEGRKKKKKRERKRHKDIQKKKKILCLGRKCDGRAGKEMRIGSANGNLSKSLNVKNKIFIL